MARISPTTRWDLVTLAQNEELRSMTEEDKLGQVASLMASVDAMDWDEALQEGDLAHWMRWQAIRALALRRGPPVRKK